MLVLSRRPSEKILFPNVGISVEIIQARGRTVRIGIEAPEDIRILRGELADKFESADRVIGDQATDPVPICYSNISQSSVVLQRIDEVRLAVALAQNQQQQGLNSNVETALEQALQQLEKLREELVPNSANETMVCEAPSDYSIGSDKPSLIFENDRGSKPSEHKSPFRWRFEFTLVS